MMILTLILSLIPQSLVLECDCDTISATPDRATGAWQECHITGDPDYGFSFQEGWFTNYQVFGSWSGTEPGFDILGHHVPLNIDPFFFEFMPGTGYPELYYWSGSTLAPVELSPLDMTFDLEPFWPLSGAPPLNPLALVGITMSFAGIQWTASYGQLHIIGTSNAVQFTVVP